jgi:transcription-repair coupling factor (superfamily II helicase)
MDFTSKTGGLWGAGAAYRLKQLYSGGRIILIAPDRNRFDLLLSELIFFFGEDRVAPFPEYTQEPFEEARILPDILSMRVNTLHKLQNDFAGVILTTPFAFAKTLPTTDTFSSSVITLKKGDTIDREELRYALEYAGYVNTELTSGKGEYTFRGDIAEIFTPQMENPVRIEFFDDEVDRIEVFDSFSRRTEKKLTQLIVLPADEALFDDDDLSKVAIDSVQEKAKVFGKFAGCHWFSPFIHKNMADITDYAGKGTVIYSLERDLEDVFISIDTLVKEKQDHYSLPTGIEKNFLTAEKIINYLNSKEIHLFEEAVDIDSNDGGLRSSAAYFTHEKKNLYQSVTDAATKIKELQDDSYKTVVCIESRKLKSLFLDFMRDHEIAVVEIHSAISVPSNGIGLYTEKVSGGFIDARGKLALITDEDIFGTVKKKVKKAKKEVYATSLSDLEPNDYVVHVDYGIGIYRGLVHKEIGGVEGDFLLLEYDGSEILYVPLDKIGQLQKYIGSEGRAPKVHSLQTSAWKKLKVQASTRAKKLAIDLLKLYADRKIRSGYAFRDDGVLVEKFEQGFEYDETDDQLAAIHDVYQDMEDEKPMERLVCGDVGFGKTEVAMRAACKAVASGKQVGVLVPTTVLARQHYVNFKKRFADMPVNVDYVSRYKTPSEIKKTLMKLAKGEIDIIIGTHRLLSKDIEFKDLGLLIIDEEQRFGVAHKEKITALKSNIDIIYLSATPIPRTLQLSMSGVRDISVIETPPEERLPVITRVIKADEEIKTAMMKELERGGQVYFLHNKVEDINSIADKIRNLVPHARLGVAHGQMTAEGMESVLYSFYQGELDVLICTTIVENGIDIANANTMIINNAAHFGLAQIYQLKGRVGRSRRRGYCYLLVPSMNSINEIARKRLKIIQQLSDLGSGVKIAFYDLQLRGAGDLLGADQSGFMVKIGYELFLQMIENAVKELKGEIDSSRDTEVASALPYFISADYVEDVSMRFDYYRRFSKISSKEEMYALIEELKAVYGDIRTETENLGWIMLMKHYAGKAYAEKLTIHTGRVRITFDKDTPVSPQKLMTAISKSRTIYKFENETSLILYFDKQEDFLEKTCSILSELTAD